MVGFLGIRKEMEKGLPSAGFSLFDEEEMSGELGAGLGASLAGPDSLFSINQ